MHAGSSSGGTNPGLPQNTDPKDAQRTERLDDPEELLQRRRAKDPAAFDKVHGKNASFAEETDGKSGDAGEHACLPRSCVEVEQTRHKQNVRPYRNVAPSASPHHTLRYPALDCEGIRAQSLDSTKAA